MFKLYDYLEKANEYASDAIARLIVNCARTENAPLLQLALADFSNELRLFSRTESDIEYFKYEDDIRFFIGLKVLNQDAIDGGEPLTSKQLDFIIEHCAPILDLPLFFSITAITLDKAEKVYAHPYFTNAEFATAEKIIAGLFNGIPATQDESSMFSVNVIKQHITPTDLLCFFNLLKSKCKSDVSAILPAEVDIDEFDAITAFAMKNPTFNLASQSLKQLRVGYEQVNSGMSISDLKQSSFSTFTHDIKIIEKALEDYSPDKPRSTCASILHDGVTRWIGSDVDNGFEFAAANKLMEVDRFGRHVHAFSSDEEYLAKLIDMVRMSRAVCDLADAICQRESDTYFAEYTTMQVLYAINSININSRMCHNSCINNMKNPNIAAVIRKAINEHTGSTQFLEYIFQHISATMTFEVIKSENYHPTLISMALKEILAEKNFSVFPKKQEALAFALLTKARESFEDKNQFDMDFRMLAHSLLPRDTTVDELKEAFYLSLAKENSDSLLAAFDAIDKVTQHAPADVSFMQPKAL